MTQPVQPSRRRKDDLAAGLAERYAEALRTADATAAEEVLRRALADGLGAAATFARIVQPVLEHLGELWERGELSIAEEHVASAISKRALAAIYPLLIEDAPRTDARVVLAGVAGELHSIGLRMISDVLDGAGFESVYLGPDTPADAIADAVRAYAPRLVALSVTMPDDLPELEHAVLAVADADPTVSILIGGRGIPERLRGYEGYVADAEDAVATAQRLLGGPPARPLVDAGGGPPRARAAGAVSEVDRQLAETTTHLADVARAQARRAREYRVMALTDPITGMANRRAWDERYAQVAQDATELTILVLDLDGFKEVNDREGHLAGDAVLHRVGASIRAALRAGDFAARLGGDEFGVLLPGTDAAGAVILAERVRAAIARDLGTEGVTASIGVARHAINPRATTLAADAALYRAKAADGDRVVAAD